jgi:hypothetical protein
MSMLPHDVNAVARCSAHMDSFTKLQQPIVAVLVNKRGSPAPQSTKRKQYGQSSLRPHTKTGASLIQCKSHRVCQEMKNDAPVYIDTQGRSMNNIYKGGEAGGA